MHLLTYGAALPVCLSSRMRMSFIAACLSSWSIAFVVSRQKSSAGRASFRGCFAHFVRHRSSVGSTPVGARALLSFQSSSMSKRSSARLTSDSKRLLSDSIDDGNDVGGSAKTKSKRTARKTTNATRTTPKTSAQDPWYTVFTKNDEQYNRYMAEEWGAEKRGDVPLFEKLSLEGAQSGLSWLTVLRKREAYRRVFHGFDVGKVAAMTEKDVQAILDETSDDTTQIVVRHRGKIESVINNAQCILKMREDKNDETSDEVFDKFLWSFVNDAPILNAWDGNLGSAPTKTDESVAMSKELKTLGFKFVGPTTCYALMQSVGMVIDYPVGSTEWSAALKRLKDRPGGYQDRSGK